MRVRQARPPKAFAERNGRPEEVSRARLADLYRAGNTEDPTLERRAPEALSTKARRGSRSTPAVLPQIDIKSTFKAKRLPKNVGDGIAGRRQERVGVGDLPPGDGACANHYYLQQRHKQEEKSESAVGRAKHEDLALQARSAQAEIIELRRVIDAQDGRILYLLQREADREIEGYRLEIEALTERVSSAERREGALKRCLEENQELAQRLTEKVAALFAYNDELMRRVDELLRYAASHQGREDFLRVYLQKLVLYLFKSST